MSFIQLLVRNFVLEKCWIYTWNYFGTFFGWLHNPTTLIGSNNHCLWLGNIVRKSRFFNEGNQELKMLKFNMFFHNTYPKEGVVCNNALFPFFFLPNPRHEDNMGKTSATLQLLNLFTIGKISIGKKKKAHGIYLRLY